MHLPGPFRAVVGLVASATDEAKHLPDRALELPMLAVSTALQASVRAQQRYARLTARGDEVLNRRRPTDEPPEWATFDEPAAPTGDLSAVPDESLSDRQKAARLLDDLFGGTDQPPTAGAGESEPNTARPSTPRKSTARKAAPAKTTAGKSDATKTTATKSGATKSGATKSGAARSAAAKSTAARSSASKAAGSTPSGSTSAARKAAGKRPATEAAPADQPAPPVAPETQTGDPIENDTASSNSSNGKAISKPRHTAPSRFDDATDD